MPLEKVECKKHSHEEGCWIKIYVPKRWIDFIREYSEYRGFFGEDKERYILMELQASIKDFIFAALDAMKKSDPEMWEYFVEKFKLEEDIKLSSDKVYLPDRL